MAVEYNYCTIYYMIMYIHTREYTYTYTIYTYIYINIDIHIRYIYIFIIDAKKKKGVEKEMRVYGRNFCQFNCVLQEPGTSIRMVNQYILPMPK